MHSRIKVPRLGMAAFAANVKDKGALRKFCTGCGLAIGPAKRARYSEID
jgi:hypothetical protein